MARNAQLMKGVIAAHSSFVRCNLRQLLQSRYELSDTLTQISWALLVRH